MDINNINIEQEIAKTAAREAGEFLLENRELLNKSVKSTKKDIKLIADLKAENLIKDIIIKKSKFPILAEESGKSDKDLGDVFWVIDPLDGTANYNRDIPICCVSIGLVKNMQPILGVIYDFNNDHMYVGDKFSNISTMNSVPINVSNKAKIIEI